MNAPLRRLALVSFVLFAMLLASATWTQAIQADSLRSDSRNSRTIVAQLGQERGPIVVDGQAVAQSEPVDDRYNYLRTYPFDERYAHVTGYFSLRYGATGLEQTESDLLTGTSEQQFVRRWSDMITGKEPSGATVTTTIDPEVQQVAARAMDGQRGAAVALDPSTGAVLAMVSVPSFDPNELATHDSEAAAAAMEELRADDQRPLINRAIAGDLYPPGSVFKVVTAAAALESGNFDADSTLPGPARLPLPQTTVTLPNASGRSCGSNDQVTFAQAMRMSCNTAFGWLGMELGGEAMREQANKFGFSEVLRIPMRVTPSTMADSMNPPQEAQSAIGQYEDRVTPLQMAMVAAGVANDGAVMRPYLVQQVQADDLSVISSTEPQMLSRAMSADTANTLTEMMVGVVDDGTGTGAQLSGVDVAGKTGTAETGGEANAHAWFISFAPADDPQIAVAVVVENGGESGGGGGRVAAPIAAQVMQAGLDR